jgi:hypothetical protein
MSWDDFGDTSDWGDWFGETGALGFNPEDFGLTGDDWFLDQETGDLVSGDEMRAIMSGSPSGVDPSDFGDSAPVGNVSGGPTGTSLSDQLRSRAADSMTQGTEPFNWDAMADPSASIASAGGTDWTKALMAGLKGLSGLMSGGGAGGGLLKGLTDTGGGGGVGTTGLPGIMSAGTPQVGGVGAPDIARAVSNLTPPGVPGLDITRPTSVAGADLMRAPSAPGLGMQDPVSAALMRLQAEGGGRVGLQGAIDPGTIADKFNPIVMPFSPGGRGRGPALERLPSGARAARIKRTRQGHP